MTGQRKRLPPFARELADIRAHGKAPVGDVAIFAGWNRGRAWDWRVVVPIDDDPAAFDYSFVVGLSCILFADTREQADRIAAAVAEYRPLRLIGVIVGEAPAIVPYVRDDGGVTVPTS